MKALIGLLLLLASVQTQAQLVIFNGVYAPPGTITDAQLLATNPCGGGNNGATVLTSDQGKETCDGTRWTPNNPPVPIGAAAAGFHTLIYFLHPVPADVNLTSSFTPGTQYFNCGYPGVADGCSGTYVVGNGTTGVQGQFTMVNPGVATGATSPNIMAAATYNNGATFANMASKLPFLSFSSGFYVEAADTTSINDGNIWSSVWVWTVEFMTTTHASPGVELDINEWGFNPASGGSCGSACGATDTLLYWHAVSGSTTSVNFSTKSLYMPAELVRGMAFDPANLQIESWRNGVNVGNLTFASASLPTNAWQGNHAFQLFGAGGHNYTGTPSYNYSIRYLAAWGPP